MVRSGLMLMAAACATAGAQSIDEIPAGLYTFDIGADLVATVNAALPEARAVDSVFLDPIYDPVIRLSEPAAVSVTLIDEGAGFRNTLAWVAMPAGTLAGLRKSDIDADGSSVVSLTELQALPGVTVGLVYPNVSRLGGGGLLVPGDSVDIADGVDFPAGTEIVFCLLQNAWKNGQVEGYSIALESTTSMYGMDMLNPEAPADADLDHDSAAGTSRHVAMLFGDADREQVIMGFEDLHRLDRNFNDFRIRSDEDFNDAIFIVRSTPAVAISASNIPEADPAFEPRPEGTFFNEDCCGVDTTQILEEELPERTNVDAAFLDPAYTPSVIVSEPTFLVLSFVGEGAIYHNSLGYISAAEGVLDGVTREEADEDGDGLVEPWELRRLPGVHVGMVFPHASVTGGGGEIDPQEAVILGDREFGGGTVVDFFLVQDGYSGDGTVADLVRDTGDQTLTFYTIDRFNPEEDAADRRHVAMLFTDDSYDSVLFGFEDLHRREPGLNPDLFASDEDFNDNVFCVTALTLGAIGETQIPVAGDSCAVDYDGSGVLDIFDALAFIEALFENSPGADLNGDGQFDVFDLLAFLELFAEGCGG